MEDLTYIQQGLEQLVAEIKNHPVPSEDTRRSYLELTLHTFNLYYVQWNTVQAARVIQQKSFPIVQSEGKILLIFAESVAEESFVMRRNSAYRGLLTESWSTFEFCLTYLCEYLFDGAIKDDLLNYEFNEVCNIIKNKELTEPERRKLEKKFIKDHLTHVPMVRKYSKIHAAYEDYYQGDWGEDKLFLEFYAKYRNSMHTNYIYHGNDKQYTFLEITYTFTNGEPIEHSEEPSINNMFDLALKLKDTCKRLFDAIQYPGLIPFPEGKVQQP
jgi:hypothetical protein